MMMMVFFLPIFFSVSNTDLPALSVHSDCQEFDLISISLICLLPHPVSCGMPFIFTFYDQT